MTLVESQKIVDEARKLIGVPWRHEGRTALGVDCIGLVILAASRAGVDLFKLAGIRPPRHYARNPSAELFTIVERYCTRAEEPKPGALLFFQFDRDRFPRHFGILTAEGTMIHAESKTRRQVIEHGYRANWLRWSHSVWLLPGVAYP